MDQTHQAPKPPFAEHTSQPEKVAGITLQHVGNEPPWHALHEEYDNTEALRRYHSASLRSFETDGFKATIRGRWDARIAELSVENDVEHDRPAYHFLLNQQLLSRIEADATQKGSPLNLDELLRVGLEEGDDAVHPNFSANAANAVNITYYGSEVAFSEEAGLAKMYASNRPLNYALGAMLADQSGHPDRLRVKELCSGSRNAHWQYAVQGALAEGSKHVDVVLSDFQTPLIEVEALSDEASIRATEYSLFEDMPHLPKEARFDAIITTYGFDSVWQPEDIRLSRRGDAWYQTLYRVKVADWNPRRDELLDAMREGKPLPHATAEDYDGIVVEEAMEPFDIDAHPFAKYIKDRGVTSINIPGGLIKRTVDAFEAQLADNGIFVSCDTGDFGLTDKDSYYQSISISGVAARFKAEDYVLAKQILEQEYGLDVQLLGLDDLAAQYLPTGWEEHASDIDKRGILENRKSGNGVMIAKRRASRPSVIGGHVRIDSPD